MYIYNNEMGKIKYILFNLIKTQIWSLQHAIYVKLLAGHLIFFFFLH